MGKRRVLSCGSHKKVRRLGPRKKSTFKCPDCGMSVYRDANLLSEKKCVPAKPRRRERYYLGEARHP